MTYASAEGRKVKILKVSETPLPPTTSHLTMLDCWKSHYLQIAQAIENRWPLLIKGRPGTGKPYVKLQLLT